MARKENLKRFNFYADCRDMITLKDVAAKSGVSLGTASAAMNGRASVKEATRKRVEQAAAELGYRKDVSAVVLAGKQRRAKAAMKPFSLGYVVSPGEVWVEERFGVFERVAGVLGYAVERVRLKEYRSLKRAAEHLRFLNVQGLYLASPGCIPGPEWKAFAWNSFSVVKGFRSWPDLRFPVIRHSPDDYMAMTRDAVIARGYRRIAALLVRSDVAEDDVVRLGALFGYARLNPKPVLEIEWRALSPGSWTTLPKEIGCWLRNYRPDAVIAFPGSLYHPLLNAGFRIPQDFAYAGVIADAEFTREYGVACCDNRGEIFPQRAVGLLHRMIQVGDRGYIDAPVETAVEPRWLDGASLPGKVPQ